MSNNHLSLSDLMKRLDDEGRQALEIALGESLRIGHFWLGIEFLLMGLSKQKGSVFPKMLQEMGIHPGQFRGVLRGMVDVAIDEDWREKDAAILGAEAFPQIQVADPDTLRKSFVAKSKPTPVLTPRIFTILQEAVKLAGEGQVGHKQLLWAAFRHHRSLTLQIFFSVVRQVGWSPEQMLSRLAELAGITPENLLENTLKPPGDILHPQDFFPPTREPQQEKSVLAAFGRDLTQLVHEEKLHPAEGESARQAIAQIERILLQGEAKNPILIGDPGVGKTAVVEGFTWRLARFDKGAIEQLAGRRVIELSANTLTAGTEYGGNLEKHLQQLLNEVKAAEGQIIVFIDEIHTILDGGAAGGLSSIADAIKLALARSEFPCIGATTVAEYRKHIEKDAALARLFTPVWIEEPTVEEAMQIVQKLTTGHLAEHHQVTVTPEAIEAAVKLSVRHLYDERLPGKAIKILDQVCSGLIIGRSLSGRPEEDFQTVKGKVVTVEAVLEVIADLTNIPVEQLAKTDKQRLLDLESALKKRVIGQDDAVAQVVRVIKCAGAGLTDPQRPFGVFLFIGPTGAGKTELALALAEALFDREEAIFRLDMSEFMEKHQVSRLIGASPGYAGYEAEGLLTEHLRRCPYSIVLLDKMEKAHKDVQRLFLQLFDTGRLTDSQGHLADGRNAIFIMTTNLEVKEAKGYQEKLKAAIDEHFTLEFLNRLDRIVYFAPLDEDALVAIFDREFAPFQARLRTEKGIEITIAQDAKRQIAKHIAKQLCEARPLRRLIEDQIVAPIVDKLLTGKYKSGTRITIAHGLKLPAEKPIAPDSDPGQMG
jgi:ATP-dependent Clp protease ATP-binding subunit ClpC